MPDWSDDYYALSGEKPPKSLFTILKEKFWKKPTVVVQEPLYDTVILKATDMAKKKDDPQLEEVIPETGDEDMIDQACQDAADEYEPADTGQKTKEEEQDAGDGQKPNEVEHAATVEKPIETQHAKQNKKTGTVKHTTSTIDDLIANVHQDAPKTKIEIPAELMPKKKVWTPDQGATVKEAAVVKKMTDDDENWKMLEIPVKKKAPPDLISGPAPKDVTTDPQPYVFTLKFVPPVDTKPFWAHFKLLKVYVSPVQKAQALLGVEALHSEYIYLWFDTFSGKAGNTTESRVRVYLIKSYDEIASFELKPNKMIDLPDDIQHVIFTNAKAPQIESFKFLEPWMPLKDKK